MLAGSGHRLPVAEVGRVCRYRMISYQEGSVGLASMAGAQAFRRFVLIPNAGDACAIATRENL